ncbi:ZIP family metal transporter [Halorussus gelatinilyticus]|uniref:ZIP family metal transporter n=1 Tax=Halorussus gelatinilyticus TaxID=2937524 RepID=A0A8U0IJ19_9EURY|nr:ZIP family metal transporter [Halorussus gelatinilyticus]UPW00798.1 ZIP family metal transporter [Halorussus gelatinilyticus]
MLTDWFVRVAGTDPVIQGLVGGVFIAVLNTLGAALVVVWPDPSERALDGALGFAAGVMLSASFTSLILPGIEIGGIGPVLVGFALGVLLLDRADQWVPHIHVLVTGRRNVRASGVSESSGVSEANASDADATETGDATESSATRTKGSAGATDAPRIEEDTPTGRERIDPDDPRTASVLLFIVAITLHNMPEGLAVGVSFGSGNVGDALALMLAIGVQNVPEGLAVAVAAASAGFGSLFYATLAGVRAGLVEIPLAVIGALAVGVAAPVLPYAMGFAAGGMLFVISDEIVPETHARGHERVATLGTMLGVAVMLYLDIVLG